MSHKHFISLYSRGFGQIFDWQLNRINNAELSRNDLNWNYQDIESPDHVTNVSNFDNCHKCDEI